MNRIHRTALALTLTVLAVVPGVALATSPALAAGCSEYNCAGHDPVNAGCSASSTKSYSGTYATVWNRYASSCKANWARAQLTTAAFNNGYSLIVIATTTDSRQQHESMCFPGPSDSGKLNEYCYPNQYYSGSAAAYTDMVDGTHVVQAFAYVYDAGLNLVATYEADQ